MECCAIFISAVEPAVSRNYQQSLICHTLQCSTTPAYAGEIVSKEGGRIVCCCVAMLGQDGRGERFRRKMDLRAAVVEWLNLEDRQD